MATDRARGDVLRRRRRWLLPLVIVFVAVAMTSCRLSGLQFTNNAQLKITEPSNLGTVKLPVTIRWRAPGLGRADGVAKFAVFLDGAPLLAVGQDLDDLADPECKLTPGCPDKSYLEQEDVFLTSSHSIRFDQLPNDSEVDGPGSPNLHEVTIMLLDRQGRRIGEGAWTVQFVVAGGGT
jgi:hypothetical protein